MSNFRVPASLAAVAFGACGGSNASIDAPPPVIHDAGPDAPPDGPSYNFSCYGVAPPTTASATVTLSGVVQQLTIDLSGSVALVPLAGATVDACPVASPNCAPGQRFDQQTSAATTGTFTTAPINTGVTPAPLDAFLKGTKSGYRPSYAYPPMPFTGDQPDIPLATIMNTTFDFAISLGVLGVTHSAGNGLMGVAATDCNLLPLNGAVISIKQNGSEVSPTNAIDGAAFGQGGGEVRFNVPPGDTVVSASFMGMTFPPHTVQVFADSTTYTGVRPGP